MHKGNTSYRNCKSSPNNESILQSKYWYFQILYEFMFLKECYLAKKTNTYVPKSNTWIVTAIISALLFAISNMLTGLASHKPLLARELVVAGNLIYAICYFALKIIKSVKKIRQLNVRSV